MKKTFTLLLTLLISSIALAQKDKVKKGEYDNLSTIKNIIWYLNIPI